MVFYPLPQNELQLWLDSKEKRKDLEEKWFIDFHLNDQNIELINYLNNFKYNNLVFHGWVLQEEDLVSILQGQFPKTIFIDRLSWREHAFFPQFQEFLRPLFLELKLATPSMPNQEAISLFSYFSLLDEESRLILENRYGKKIKLFWEEEWNKAKSSKSTKEFESEISLVFSENNILFLNQLSRLNVATKVKWVEERLQLFHHKQCTAQLAYWMVSKLKKLNLDEKQFATLHAISEELKNGTLVFEADVLASKKANPIWKKGILALGFVLIGVCFYVLWNWKTEGKPTLVFEGSSLSVLSKAERIRLDTLLRKLTVEPRDSSEIEYYGSGVSISLRQAFINLKAERAYTHLEEAMHLHYEDKIDSCSRLSKTDISKAVFTETEAISKKKNGEKATIKNTSDYEVIVLIWSEKRNEKVYSKLLNAHQTLNLNVAASEKMLLLPGNNLGKIYVTNSPLNRSIHFHSIDFNYEAYLQQVFIWHPNSSDNKVLIEGKKGDFFEVIAQGGILERE